MRHISTAITQATYRNPSLLSVPSHDRHGTGIANSSRQHVHSEKTASKQKPRGVDLYALPSEEQSWYLIEQYFAKTGQLLPFIHEQSFRETYSQMKRHDFTRVRRTWLGLLNIIFAIAMSLCTDGDIPTQQRIDQSDVFYQRANALCDRESRRNTSLEMGKKDLRCLNACRVTKFMFEFSAISAHPGAVPPRNAKVRPSVDDPRPRYFCCFPAWYSFPRGQQSLSSARM